MFFKFKPKSNIFFEQFAQSTRLARRGAYLLEETMQDHEKVAVKMEEISDLEHKADKLNDMIIDKLNRVFLTPLDREDIYALATMLDDEVDFFQGILELMAVYKIGKPPEGAIELAQLLVKCTERLVSIFDMLQNIKGNQEEILAQSRRIVDLESRGDTIYRREVAQLFTTCKDPIEIIKWKDLLQKLEDALDHCEKIADLIRGVVLKYV